MALVISKKILVSNAFFAKQKKELKYEEIDKFRKILYKTIAKDFKFVLFTDEDADDLCIDVDGKIFIKRSDGVLNLNTISDKDINEINSPYPKDVQKLFAIARSEFKETR